MCKYNVFASICNLYATKISSKFYQELPESNSARHVDSPSVIDQEPAVTPVVDCLAADFVPVRKFRRGAAVVTFGCAFQAGQMLRPVRDPRPGEGQQVLLNPKNPQNSSPISTKIAGSGQLFFMYGAHPYCHMISWACVSCACVIEKPGRGTPSTNMVRAEAGSQRRINFTSWSGRCNTASSKSGVNSS